MSEERAAYPLGLPEPPRPRTTPLWATTEQRGTATEMEPLPKGNLFPKGSERQLRLEEVARPLKGRFTSDGDELIDFAEEEFYKAASAGVVRWEERIPFFAGMAALAGRGK